MKNNERSGAWQDVHTVLSQQATPELLLLLQELYALNTANKDFLHAQVLPPKTAPLWDEPWQHVSTIPIAIQTTTSGYRLTHHLPNSENGQYANNS